jgi:antitoxin VapB
MAQEWRTKSFKSGNSVAIRLPKALGFAEGEEITIVRHADGSFTIWKPDRDADILDSLYGSFSEGFMAEGRGETEQEERDWSIALYRGHAA